jgi:hypothetical protein
MAASTDIGEKSIHALPVAQRFDAMTSGPIGRPAQAGLRRCRPGGAE